MKDKVEYPSGPPDIPRWFIYLTHWVNKRLFCRHGHTVTVYRSCNTCGEYVR